MPLSVNCTKLMYVGLIFSVPGVSFDFDSPSFEVSICGLSPKHKAAPKKQSAKINPAVVVFMRPIEPRSPLPVNISLFAREQSGLSMRIAATITGSIVRADESRIGSTSWRNPLQLGGAKRI